MTERQLKYRWARTREGVPHDYSAYDGDRCIGRVTLHDTGPELLWTWFVELDERIPFGPNFGGYLSEKMAACRRVEEVYDTETAKLAAKDPPD